MIVLPPVHQNVIAVKILGIEEQGLNVTKN